MNARSRLWAVHSADIALPGSVRLVEAIAYAVILANVINLYFARFGVFSDVLVLAASIPAFLWTIAAGFDARRIRLYMVTVAAMFCLYFVYSAMQFSMQGFQNSVAIFVVATTFLFFFRASSDLRCSRGFLLGLLMPLASFVFLSESTYAVGKNVVNGAVCYYLIAIFFCSPGLMRMRTRHVVLLFILIFTISAINGHRALAGSSVLLLLQYFLLNINIARAPLRILMFVALMAVVGAVISLLVNPDMAVIASAADAFVTSDGSRTLMSGRQILWPVVWDAIVANPVLGAGPGMVLADIYSTTLSAHNLYLQVGLQIGFVGFVLLALLFWSLWRAARPTGLPATQRAENIATVVVTMVIVHSLFEVFLLQNALAIGVPVWMVLGLALGALAREAGKTDFGRQDG